MEAYDWLWPVATPVEDRQKKKWSSSLHVSVSYNLKAPASEPHDIVGLG